MKLDKNFNSQEFESLIYSLWEKEQVFLACPEKNLPRFSMIMPPPNETGTLGVHHVLFLTIQDILARHNRLLGKDVLWLPGTDHAALPVNALMEKSLALQGLTKHDIGRQKFLEKTEEFVQQSRGKMLQQMRMVGASADWTRLRYTLEDTSVRVVNETFIKMYQKGLIYRGDRIINWDPVLETTVSDDEVSYKSEKTTLYYFKLGPFQISTVRPETKFGDKYIVMHPNDQRYKDYQEGQEIKINWINGEVTMTIIKDEAVDPNFGSGVMTITPWHSLVDYEIARRHNLQYEQIIDWHGRLLPAAGQFAGLTINEARPQIVEKLNNEGLLIKKDDNYFHQVAYNTRSNAVIEPQIKLQWFIDVNKKVIDWQHQTMSFKEILQEVVKRQEIAIIPARFEKTYFNWINNLKDWCISRQIWWGHRIPAWYRVDEDGQQELYVGLYPPTDDSQGFHQWEQDPDTLDTWFSSALWTFSTLIDPIEAQNFDISFEELLKRSLDFQTYHPTTILETGWDIIFFWVARMILATTFMTAQIPFKTVYLHGLVRSSDGKKMSKSRPESLIDPIDVINQFGADALRLGIIMGVSPGNDLIYSEEKVRASRNFCNKLWNIARYTESVLNQNPENNHHQTEPIKTISLVDQWILFKLSKTQKKVLNLIEKYKFAEAYEVIYHFVWDDYADWYIEASKVNLNREVLEYSFRNLLKLIHPFAPFVSETIWQTLFSDDNNLTLLAKQRYETNLLGQNFDRQANSFLEIQQIITESREVIKKTDSTKVSLYFTDSEVLRDNQDLVKELAKLKACYQVEAGDGWHLTTTSFNCWLDINPAVINKYKKDVEQQVEVCNKQLENLTNRLNNQEYLSKAPKEIVEQSRNNKINLEAKIQALQLELERFS